jgi:hypothetical protein
VAAVQEIVEADALQLIVWVEGDMVPGCNAATGLTISVTVPRLQVNFKVQPVVEVQVTFKAAAYNTLLPVAVFEVLDVPVITPPVIV